MKNKLLIGSACVALLVVVAFLAAPAKATTYVGRPTTGAVPANSAYRLFIGSPGGPIPLMSLTIDSEHGFRRAYSNDGTGNCPMDIASPYSDGHADEGSEGGIYVTNLVPTRPEYPPPGQRRVIVWHYEEGGVLAFDLYLVVLVETPPQSGEFTETWNLQHSGVAYPIAN